MRKCTATWDPSMEKVLYFDRSFAARMVISKVEVE